MGSDSGSGGGLIARISSKVVAANLAAGAVATGVLALYESSVASAFAAGAATGALNIFWLMRVARKGLRMTPEKAGRYVMMAYPARFAVVALLFALFIVKGRMSPWPLVAGFALSIAATVCAMIYFAREEARDA